MTTKQTQQAEAIARLRALLPPGSKVHTVLRHVSRSGMSRSIDCYLLKDSDRVWLSRLIHKATGISWDNGRECLKMGGCGMDMGFAIVSDLSYTLYPDSFECIGEGCPANDHSNGDRDYTPHMHDKGAAFYALKHDWL